MAQDVEGSHVPVLPDVVLEMLDPRADATIVDATVGLGGHARAILDRLGPAGRLIALDQDPRILERLREGWQDSQGRQDPRVTLIHANFAELEGVLRRAGLETVDGVLADLGVSSPQLDNAERGFSFMREGPLDMRMDPTQGEPASRLLARISEHELADVLWTFGEERASRRIARRIVETRVREPLVTTTQLADLVRQVLGRPRQGIDPATRTFQALRIAVNDELAALDALLDALPRVVRPGGSAVLIAFHSLEDRRIKQAFRDQRNWTPLTKKPTVAGPEEIRSNPRSRSAKLRAARRNAEA